MPGSHITSPLPEEKTHGQPASARLQKDARRKMIFNLVIATKQLLKLTRFHNLQRQALTQFIKLYQYMI